MLGHGGHTLEAVPRTEGPSCIIEDIPWKQFLGLWPLLVSFEAFFGVLTHCSPQINQLKPLKP